MNDNTPARIIVIDDHRGARESLKALLESAGFLVSDYSSATAFLEAGMPEGACMIVDVHMPEMSGLELQGELVRRKMDLPLILVTGQADVPLAVKAMRAGAFDFLEKPFDDEKLLESIGRALAAGRKMPPPRSDVQAALERLALLTERERDVLDRLALGETNKGIGQALGISPRTVEVHRARVLDKMQARNLADLVRTARIAGIE